MLPGVSTLQAFTPKDRVEIERGRCVRHRFAKSTCDNCFKVCPADAFEWGDTGLHWKAYQCKGCLLCVASCPTGALQASETSFVGLLRDLAKVDNPVLACSSIPQTVGHARLPCLGILADAELLLAMLLALGKPIHLNLTVCGNCYNRGIVAQLDNARKCLEEIAPEQPQNLEFVSEKNQLHFQERTCSRRDFFSLLRHRSQSAGLCIADRLQTDQLPAAYGTKQLPVARRLLLQVLEQLPELSPQIARKLFPQRTTNQDCLACTGCVGICPTGALLPPTETGMPPEFCAEHCISCRLCEDFCSRSGITITAPG